MSAVLSPLNLMQAQYNSPSKKQVPTLPLEDEADDSFSFTLTQVQHNGKTEAAKAPVKVSNVQGVLSAFDQFLREQRAKLPTDLERANTKAQRDLVLNTFFDTVESYRSQMTAESLGQATQPAAEIQGCSPAKKSKSRKSPVKSPQKRQDKENGEITSPQKLAVKSPQKKVQSPVKLPSVSVQNAEASKEGRKSQRRRRDGQDLECNEKLEKHEEKTDYLQVPTETRSLETSPLKSCKKSPLKRMKKLEDQDHVENQENIETTYIKAKGQEQETQQEDEEDMEETTLEPRFMQADMQAKSLLGQQASLTDELSATETQLMNRGTDISEVIDVDSNVINYG